MENADGHDRCVRSACHADSMNRKRPATEGCVFQDVVTVGKRTGTYGLHVPVMSMRVLAVQVSLAMRLIFAEIEGHFICHAFIIVVETAVCDLAGSDT